MNYINELIAETIILLNAANVAQTGEAGNITTTLQKNGSYSITPTITVTEIDSVNFPGAYRVTYTPDAEGDFAIRAVHATYNPAGWMIRHEVLRRPAGLIYDAALASNNTDILFLFGLMLDGVIQISPTSITVNIYDAAGVIVNTGALVPSAFDSQGIGDVTWTGGNALLNNNTVYQVNVVFIDANGTSYTFTKLLKKE